MTAHRYWRLAVLANNDSGGTQVTLFCTVELRGVAGGPNLATGGTAFGDTGYYTSSEGPDKAFDGSDGTWWQPGLGSNHFLPNIVYLGYDFGSAVEINEVRALVLGGYPERTPRAFIVQSSDDNATFADEWFVLCGEWGGTLDRTFTRPSVGAAATMWAILANDVAQPGGDVLAGCEVQFFEVGAAVSSGGTPFSSKIYGGGFEPSKAFDGNNSTIFIASAGRGVWLGYEFGSTKAIDRFDWKARTDGYYNQGPKNGYVLKGTDGINFLGAWTFANASYYTAGEVRSFVAPDAGGSGVSQSFGFHYLIAEANQPSDVSQLATLIVTESHADTVVGQIPVMLLSVPHQPTLISQLPVLLLSVPTQPADVSQLPISVLTNVKQIPPPFPVVPEIGLRETWSFATTVNTFDKGAEQRARRRRHPRVTLSFKALILEGRDRRELVELFWHGLQNSFAYPFFQYSTQLQKAAAPGDTDLFFRADLADVRDGELLSVFDPFTERNEFLLIDQATEFGATLAAPLAHGLRAGMMLASVGRFRMAGRSASWSQGVFAGSGQIVMESVGSRPITRGDGILPILLGRPLLDKRPAPDVSNSLINNATLYDVDTNDALDVPGWRFPELFGSARFLFDRFNGQLQFWRDFADYTKGNAHPFYMPTFRPDILPLADPRGTATFKTDDLQVRDLLRNPALTLLRIEQDAGTIYRRTYLPAVNYNPTTGEPQDLTFVLDAALPDSPTRLISFCPLVRVDGDDFELEHSVRETELSFRFKTVRE